MNPRRESKKYYEKLIGKRFDKNGNMTVDIGDLKTIYYEGFIYHFQAMRPSHHKLVKKILKGINKETTRLKEYFGTGEEE